MQHKQIRPVLLVIKDLDAKTFAIEGPMTDDTRWLEIVCRLQNRGRVVAFDRTHENREKLIQYWEDQGFTLVESGDVVRGTKFKNN